MIACGSMLTYIYIYAGKWMSSCCVRVRVHGLLLYAYMYMNILQFFFSFSYGVAGKEDRKIKQLNEK